MRNGLILLAGWTFCNFLSFGIAINYVRAEILNLARTRAELTLNKDMVYRRWASSKGWLYVPVAGTEPNPYLNVPHREVVTTAGHYLTLVDHVYMTRQVNEMQKQAGLEISHITSLKPLRPENRPDEWERKALMDFEAGKKEVSGIDVINGRDYFRLMRPFVMESSCMKCHAQQGYNVGQIRGGISTSIPMEPLYAVERRTRLVIVFVHVIFWFFGAIGIVTAMRRVNYLIHRAESAEDQARHNRERAEGYLNIAAEIIVMLDAEGKIALVNESGCRLLGYEKGELEGKDWFDTCLPEEARQPIREYFFSLKSNSWETLVRENRILRKDGSVRDILWHNAVLRNRDGSFAGTLSSGMDITDRRRNEDRIRELLSERELLLKEIHHRVKNNMMMVASILGLQASRLSDPDAVAALNESRGRVVGMAALYEQLFVSHDFRYIAAKEYLTQILRGIQATHSTKAAVTIDTMFDDDLFMDAKVLFPIGIIVNELVTNAYKYAFQDRSEGRIEVSFLRKSGDLVEITVRDDGIGIPETAGVDTESSFGMRLVDLMVKQIGGRLECLREGGTMFRVTLRYPSISPRHLL